MSSLDVFVLVGYLFVVVGWGCLFARSNTSSEKFMSAGRGLPGWVVGLSIFGSYVSSISFLANPGKAYGENWNVFVFALSLPLAAWAAARWFVPFFRQSGEISAYQHLEHRFGAWARTYGVVCYLLTQLTRLGMILYLLAVALQPMIQLELATIILISGFVVTIYPFFGGSEGVIWTGAVQAVVLVLGVVVCLATAMMGIPDGPPQVIQLANQADKFSLGSFGLGIATSTFWVVMLNGIATNMQNFGIDQSYVQRYITARSDRAARLSVWMGAISYIPLSAALLLIGTALWVFYQVHPDQLPYVLVQVTPDVLPRLDPGFLKQLNPEWAVTLGKDTLLQVNAELLPRLNAESLPAVDPHVLSTMYPELVSKVSPALLSKEIPELSLKADPHVLQTLAPDLLSRVDAKVLPVGLKPDQMFPFFIRDQLPVGLRGLVLAAICSAAMDSNLNCCATLYLNDIHRRYFRPRAGEWESMWALRLSVLLMGALSTYTGVLMIGAKYALDLWWMLAGIMGGGILGLFLLGLLFRRANGLAAGVATIAGVVVILWMTITPKCQELADALLKTDSEFAHRFAQVFLALKPYAYLGHANLIVVIGTLVILGVGAGLSFIGPFRRETAYAMPRTSDALPSS